MRLDSILKKATYQISNPTYLDRAEMAMVGDIEKFAKTTMQMKKVGSGIMDYISNPAVTAGIGGLAAGGGTYLSASKKDDESDKEFAKRRILDALTNGVAGAAVGGAIPVAASAINGIANPNQDSLPKAIAKKTLGLSLWGGGGAAAGFGANAYLNRDKAIKGVSDRINDLSESLRSIQNDGLSGLAHAAKKSLSGVTPTNEIADLIEAAGKTTGNIAKRDAGVINELLSAARATEARQAARATPILSGGARGILKSVIGGKLMLPAIGTVAALGLPTILKKIDQASS